MPEEQEAITYEYIRKIQRVEQHEPKLSKIPDDFYDKAKKFEDALNCYEKAIKLDEEFEDAWFNKGVALNALGKLKETLECMEKILTINPNNESAREAVTNFIENKRFIFN